MPYFFHLQISHIYAKSQRAKCILFCSKLPNIDFFYYICHNYTYYSQNGKQRKDYKPD